jgi:hypothetical protein
MVLSSLNVTKDSRIDKISEVKESTGGRNLIIEPLSPNRAFVFNSLADSQNTQKQYSNMDPLVEDFKLSYSSSQIFQEEDKIYISHVTPKIESKKKTENSVFDFQSFLKEKNRTPGSATPKLYIKSNILVDNFKKPEIPKNLKSRNAVNNQSSGVDIDSHKNNMEPIVHDEESPKSIADSLNPELLGSSNEENMSIDDYVKIGKSRKVTSDESDCSVNDQLNDELKGESLNSISQTSIFTQRNKTKSIDGWYENVPSSYPDTNQDISPFCINNSSIPIKTELSPSIICNSVPSTLNSQLKLNSDSNPLPWQNLKNNTKNLDNKFEGSSANSNLMDLFTPSSMCTFF